MSVVSVMTRARADGVDFGCFRGLSNEAGKNVGRLQHAAAAEQCETLSTGRLISDVGRADPTSRGPRAPSQVLSCSRCIVPPSSAWSAFAAPAVKS